MLLEFRSGRIARHASRGLLTSAAIAAILSAGPALATSFTVGAGVTDTMAKTVSGADTGTINATGTLSVATAITWNAATTGSGVIIYNYGAISATTRGIDTSGSTTARNFALYNYTGASINSTNDAFRINTALLGGTIDVDNSGTIKSSTGQAFDFATLLSGGMVVNITNRAGGIIQSDGDDAIRAGSGTITIDNAGTIKADAATMRAININNAAVITAFSLTNKAGATIESDDDAVRISSTPTSVGNIVIDNSGTIKTLGTAGGQAIDLDGVNHAVDTTTTITNRATGIISSTNADAVRPGSNATVNNYGTITAGSTDMAGGFLNDGSSDGIDLQAHSGKINNYQGGSITGARHGITAGLGQTVTVYNEGAITGSNGSGIGSDGYGTVTNYGTITGTANLNYCTSNPNCFGDGDGVDIDYVATIYNYGTIQGTGAVGIKSGETSPSHSEGLAIGGGTVVNGDTTHTSALISGADYGITVDNSDGGDALAATSITNYGTIRGLNGYAIRLVDTAGAWSNTITNYSTISGTSATTVLMGDGNDTFNNYGGSVTGIVDAQGGSDTLNIDRGALSTFTLVGSNWLNFDTTNVKSGAVKLSGSYASTDAFTVSAGASLTGSDKVTTALLTNNGKISTGTASTLGTFTVDGDFTNTSTGTYLVKLGGANSDLINVTGLATLGGTVEVSSLSTLTKSSYTILSAADGLSGNFNGLVSHLSPFVRGTLGYGLNNVTLAINPVADSKSGASVADALTNGMGAGPQLTQVLNDIGAMSAADAGKALDQLAPEQSSGASFGVMQMALGSHMQTNQRIGALQSAAASERGGVRLALGGGQAGDLTASLVGGSVSTAADAGFWLRGVSLSGNLDAQSGAANGLSYNGGGFEGGYDRFIGDATLVGVSAGYARIVNDPDRQDASSDVTSYSLGLYAATLVGAVDLSGQANYARNDYHATRHITILPPPSAIAAADFNGTTLSANVEAGYTMTYGNVALRPALGLDWVRLESDGYTETGAPGLNLTQGSRSDTLVRSSVGASAALTGGTVTPSLGLRWGHDIDQPDGALSYAFAGLANSTFLIDRNTPARDALLVDAGLDTKLAKAVDLSLTGSADLRSDAQAYGLSLKLRYNW